MWKILIALIREEIITRLYAAGCLRKNRKGATGEHQE